MARLALRKAVRTSRKPARTKRKFASFKNLQKTPNQSQNEVYLNTIDKFLSNIRTVAKRRVSNKGASDKIARKLNASATNARGQLRKTNIINSDLTKHLHNIGYSLRGVKEATSSIRAELPRVFRKLREGVRKDVVFFLGTLNRSIRSMTYELTKLETVLRRNYASVKAGTKRYKIDPAIKRHIKTWENKVANFKSKWGKLINGLSTHGNVQVQAGVRMIKKELEALQKSIRTDRVLMNSIVKASSSKRASKVRIQPLITKAEIKRHYNKWLKKQQLIQEFRNRIYTFTDQLKAIKTA